MLHNSSSPVLMFHFLWAHCFLCLWGSRLTLVSVLVQTFSFVCYLFLCFSQQNISVSTLKCRVESELHEEFALWIIVLRHLIFIIETTETDIITTEIIKRRDVGPYGIRSEYCIRKIICPLGNRDTPKGKSVCSRTMLDFAVDHDRAFELFGNALYK